MALFKRLNRDEPERIFVSFENNEGSALVKDQTIQIDHTSQVDGVKARQHDSALLCHLFLGIVDAAVATGGWGLAQTYGYRSSSIVWQTDTSQDTGVLLVPVSVQNYLQSVASTFASNTTVTIRPVYAYLLESIASAAASATISKKIWIRAM
jgi:hypothetical protein